MEEDVQVFSYSYHFAFHLSFLSPWISGYFLSIILIVSISFLKCRPRFLVTEDLHYNSQSIHMIFWHQDPQGSNVEGWLTQALAPARQGILNLQTSFRFFLKLVPNNPNISPRVLTDCDLLEVSQKMCVPNGSQDFQNREARNLFKTLGYCLGYQC